MTDTKPLVASKTFWGTFISFVPVLASVLGVSAVQLGTTATQVMQAIGAILALYGTVTRSKKIKGIF